MGFFLDCLTQMNNTYDVKMFTKRFRENNPSASDIEKIKNLLSGIKKYYQKEFMDKYMKNPEVENLTHCRQKGHHWYIYNDFVCCIINDEYPDALGLFISDKALKTTGYGKGFTSELYARRYDENVKAESSATCIIFTKIKMHQLWPMIDIILRDDHSFVYKPLKFIKPKRPKTKVKKYNVTYFPVKYDKRFADVMKKITIINLEWAKDWLPRSVLEGDYVRSKFKITMYSELKTAVENQDVEKFVESCSMLCAYHYMLKNVWNNIDFNNQNLSASPLLVENDLKSLYRTRAMVAKLKEISHPVFSYLMTKTRVFRDVNYDYQSYDFYVKKIKQYTRNNKRRWGSYEDSSEPLWVSETSSHSVMFPNSEMRRYYDKMMTESYRKLMYDEETYNEYFWTPEPEPYQDY